MSKLAVLFPGIGYTCDKPLLYFSRKLLKNLGYEIISVVYKGFPEGVKGDSGKMKQAIHLALEQAEEMLEVINWPEYEEIVFVSKSIGTAVGAAYAQRHWLRCRHILFTPVEEVFQFNIRNAIVFHGTGDPWVETKLIEENCNRLGIPMYETEGANHSLETGDTDADIKTLRKTMKLVREFAEGSTRNMSRMKELQKQIYKMLDGVDDPMKAMAHLHGVSLAAVMIAKKRGEDPELAAMAGLLHDLWAYKYGTYDDHAHLGSEYARKLLEKLGVTDPDETQIICSAIWHHDDKENDGSPMDEVLKDADVLDHIFTDPTKEIREKERERYERLCGEFGLRG